MLIKINYEISYFFNKSIIFAKSIELNDEKMTLFQKDGSQVETREQLHERFVQSRPTTPSLSEGEIMEEVKAVRYLVMNPVFFTAAQ